MKLFEIHGNRGVLKAKSAARTELESVRMVVNYDAEIVLLDKLLVSRSKLIWLWYIGGGLAAVLLVVVLVKVVRRRREGKRAETGEVSDYTITMDEQGTYSK